MNDEHQTEIIVGLSDGEKKDLEKLITEFREKESLAPPDPSAEDVHNQIKSISTELAQFGDVLLNFDTKMKSFYKILLLSYKKSEIMNQRIDTIIEIMKDRKNL